MVTCTICNQPFFNLKEYREYAPKCIHEDHRFSDVEVKFDDSSGGLESNYAVVGAIGSGKSYFIYSLLHTLLENQPAELTNYMDKVNMYVQPPLGEKAREQYKKQKTMMLNGTIIGTRRRDEQNNVPINISIKVGRGTSQKKIRITFFDISGENFANPNYLRQEARVHKAKGIIFLIPPWEDVRLNNLLKDISDYNFEVDDFIIYEHLFQAIRHNTNAKYLRKVSTPIAFCLSMFDLLEDYVPEKIKGNPYLEMDTMMHNNLFDFPKAESNGIKIKNFLTRNSRLPLKGIEDKFSKVNYFAISSIGHSDFENIRTREFQPKGILAPLFWLMAENQFIQSTRNNY